MLDYRMSYSSPNACLGWLVNRKAEEGEVFARKSEEKLNHGETKVAWASECLNDSADSPAQT